MRMNPCCYQLCCIREQLRHGLQIIITTMAMMILSCLMAVRHTMPELIPIISMDLMPKMSLVYGSGGAGHSCGSVKSRTMSALPDLIANLNSSSCFMLVLKMSRSKCTFPNITSVEQILSIGNNFLKIPKSSRDPLIASRISGVVPSGA